MKTSRLATACPICGSTIDRATHAFGQAVPKPGDVNLCSRCCGLSIYTDTLGLRLPTGEEAAAMLSNPEMVEAIRAARAKMGAAVEQARREETERN